MKSRMKKIIFSLLGAFVLGASFVMPAYAFSPTSTPLYNGIDVSEWQGTIDFSAVKASGQEVVYKKFWKRCTLPIDINKTEC